MVTRVSDEQSLSTEVVLRRYVQFVIDRLLLVVGSMLLLTIVVTLGFMLLKVGWPRFLLYLLAALWFLGMIGGGLWLDVWLPYRNGGATPAMRWLRLRIVTLDGTPPRLRDYVVRWALLVVDGVLLGIVGAVLIAVTDRHQRLGDIVARTLVVKVA